MNAFSRNKINERMQRLAAEAVIERQEMGPDYADNGYVLFHEDQVCGWAHALIDAEAFRWCPGVIAISAQGIGAPIHMATGGDYYDGAEEWLILWDPAIASSQVRRKPKSALSPSADLALAISGGFPIHVR